MISQNIRDHNKLYTIINQRLNYMRSIKQWFQSNEIQKALFAINQLSDPALLVDAITMANNNRKLFQNQQLSLNADQTFLSKSQIVIDSRYTPHVVWGLDLNLKLLGEYQKDIMNIRMHGGGGVDLAREERIKKYDGLIDKFKQTYNHKRLIKNKNNTDEVGVRANQLYT